MIFKRNIIKILFIMAMFMPLIVFAFSVDTDGDFMPDDWETQYGLDPYDNTDANGHLDGDGYTNLEEYGAGTDPESDLSNPGTSSTAELILRGRELLENQELVAANNAFKFAVSADPADDEANFFYAVTRLLNLIESNQEGTDPASIDSVKEMLDRFGITPEGRTLYDWTADYQRDSYGEVVLPDTTPTGDEIEEFMLNYVLPEISGALDNLSMINTSFQTMLTPQMFNEVESAFGIIGDVEVDYTDIAFFKASLHAVKSAIYLATAYDSDNMDIVDLDSRLNSGPLIVEDILNLYPDLLTVKRPENFAYSETSLSDAITSYYEASDHLRSETDDQLDDLISIDPVDMPDEEEFRLTVEDIELSMQQPTDIRPDDPDFRDFTGDFIRLDLTRLFGVSTQEYTCHSYDTDCDWCIGDFELLDAIDEWVEDNVGDFELLDIIDLWVGECYCYDSAAQQYVPDTDGNNIECQFSVSVRDILPEFIANRFCSMPDPTINGIWPNFSQADWSIFFDDLSEITVFSGHWPDGYYAEIVVEDDYELIQSVTAAGPGISGIMGLVYESGDGSNPAMWWHSYSPFLGSSVPTTPQTYTITVTDDSGSCSYETTITGYVEEFADYLYPSGEVSGSITFRWVGISDADDYSIELSDSNFNGIWDAYVGWWTSSVYYDGPSLSPGQTYNYAVRSERETDGVINYSFAKTSFVYTGFDEPAPGSVSGRVTYADTGLPVPYVYVRAHTYQTMFNDWKGSALADADGYYTISNLPPGYYRIESNSYGDYAGEYYNNTYDFDSAEAVFVAADENSGDINFSLSEGGSISGRVTDDITGEPIADIWISAQGYYNWYSGGGAYTDTNGDYAITGLRPEPESHRVTAYGNETYNYNYEYYDNTYDWNMATPVSVNIREDTGGIDFGLSQ